MTHPSPLASGIATHTTTTIHGGAPHAATPGWFGSLPWSWDHALQFFTTP